ncbi:MAG: zinc-binding dehydrogenase [Hyphomicrobiaceae bacterium]|nr:zinc-binding dehydrogenase [Hyphomicrobiaceae bacterium]
MRAAIFRQGNIVVDELPEPRPGRGQVLARTLACGICGTDLHARLHAPRMVEMSRYVPWRQPMDLTRDVVFGHEFCCEILELGPGCRGRFNPGTRVVSVPRLIVDGRMEGIGYSNSNVGAYAERMLLSEDLLIEVPPHVSSELASLTEPLSIGIHAVEKAALAGDEVPLVIGCGPIGLAVIAALSQRGIGPIIAADYSAGRRALARRIGADVVVDPAQTSPYKTWDEHAALSPEAIALRPTTLNPAVPRKPAVIFECVGVPGVIQSVIEGAPQAARVVVVGVCMETDRQEPMFACFKELSMQYVLGCTPDEFASSLDMIAGGRIDAGALITGKVGLDGVAGAFDELASPQRHTKIVIEPWRV